MTADVGAPSTAVPRQRGSVRVEQPPPLHRPLTSYHLIAGSSLLLLFLGLVMVFSASSVRSYASFGSSYTFAAKQGTFIAMGLPLMWAASRLPTRFWRMSGYPLLLGSLVLLVVVLMPAIGKEVDGARRWIPLPGGLNLQPSELAKMALVLWGSDLLVRKKKLLGDWKHLFIPLIPVTCLVLALIMLEPDMGTTMATVVVVVALLWVVGTPLRYFGVFLVTLVGIASVLAVAEPYRMARLVAFIDPCAPHHRLDGGFQACQGLLAMGSGGIFGVGLGASREKWAGGLPNAHTDFVFAIIGEELGLLGSLTVLALFATLIYGGIRVAKRTTDPFARLAAAGVTTWFGAQAAINVGAVVGLLPITGIPLPLVSFGGSSLLLNLVAIGMLLSFARCEPGAPEALAARSGSLAQLISRSPLPVAPVRAASRRARRRPPRRR